VPVEAVEPTPDEAVELADELRRLMDGMDEEERQIVMLRMEEYTYPEIAERIGRSKRTVRRIVKRVQSRLQGMLEHHHDR
jgi:RNA polymerase sigma factor (sigma-70 family)